MRDLSRPLLATFALLLACGGGGNGPPPAQLDCDGIAVTALAAGGHAIIDPVSTGGCLRLPAAGPAGAEHLVVALSAAAQETPTGTAGTYTLRATTDTFSPIIAGGAGAGSRREPDPAAAFHALLRAREVADARRPGVAGAALRRGSSRAIPPVVGEQRTFKVCRTTACTGFASVLSTARYVGTRGAIFVDDTIPAGGYTQPEIDSLGLLFDQHLYAIDTTAFGRESDLDGNGVVIILLTDRVNALSPNCTQTGSVILGYFFSLDLTNDPDSNGGEVFYSMVPDPSVPQCFGKAFAQGKVGPTFIHEFQHMISFHRHVLLGGGAPEEVWLNEGLSHLAEELGGRLVAGGFCSQGNCLNQFAAGNIRNAFEYLTGPQSHFVVVPGSSNGTLSERGAVWLFSRWLADRAPTDSILGTELTRRLLGADQPGGLALTGGANVTQAAQLFQAGVTFPTLLGQWHLANWTEQVAGFTEPSGRLRYRSWDLQSAFDQLFPGPYPLFPDSTAGASYQASGTLRGGTGRYVRVVQPANGAAVAIGLVTGNTGPLAPRYAVVRVR
jgi:hypothetical protein